MILLKVRCTHDTRNTIKVGSLPERNGILGLVNLFATLKTRKKLGRVNFRKDSKDCYQGSSKKMANSWPWRVPSLPSKRFCAVSEPRTRNESHFSSCLGFSLLRNYTETLVMQANPSTDKQYTLFTTLHLCTRFRIDGIKAMSRGGKSQGANNW